MSEYRMISVELIERTICRLTHGHEHDKAVCELRALLSDKPQATRCPDCGYLTSEREHLGCLRKAVSDLDAATGGQPQASDAQSAPVGEREAFNEWYVDAIWGNEDFKQSVGRGFQAGAAWQRTQAARVPEGADAQIGAVVWRYIDRMTDICTVDPAERILEQFVAEVRPIMLAAAPAQPAVQETYPECDYCGVTPDHHPWHGSGALNGVESRHIHACNACRSLLPASPAQSEVQRLREALEQVLAEYDALPKRSGHALPGRAESEAVGKVFRAARALAASTGQEVKHDA